MVIRFLCPQGHRLVAAAEIAGQTAQCPDCLSRVVVPVRTPRPSGKQKRGWSDRSDDDDDHDGDGDDDHAAAVGSSSYQPSLLEHRVGASAQAATAEWNLPQPLPPAPSGMAPPPDVASAPAPLPPGAFTAASVPGPGPVTAGHSVATQAEPGPIEDLAARFEEPPAIGDSDLPQLRVKEDDPLERTLAKQAGSSRMMQVYSLAGLLFLVALASAIPAIAHLNVLEAPGWARALLLVACLQIVYVVWMVALPDWSTVWLGMLFYAVLAGFFAMVWMIAVFAAPNQELLLGLHTLPRHQIAGWSACSVLATGLMSYICGRFSSGWRREFELARREEMRAQGIPL